MLHIVYPITHILSKSSFFDSGLCLRRWNPSNKKDSPTAVLLSGTRTTGRRTRRTRGLGFAQTLGAGRIHFARASCICQTKRTAIRLSFCQGPVQRDGGPAAQAVWALPKPLAQGEFTSPEQVVFAKQKRQPYGCPFCLEQVKGVEPSYQAWEACVLPMNYTCL